MIELVRREFEGNRQQPAPMPDQIVEGGRNHTLFRAACKLRRSGWSAEEIYAAVQVTNQNHCHPPLPDA